MELRTAGDNAVIIYFGTQISAEVAHRVRCATIAVTAALGDELIDLIPSYASLLVIFDALRTDHMSVRQRIHSAISQLNLAEQSRADNVVVLPVYYGHEVAIDLAALAARANMTSEQVINLHSSGDYRVYAIGFAPGFAYLGEVDERIAAPRLATPRKKVPRGAVAIADRQTAVYPAQSPGGWNIIGRCPVRLFDPQSDPVMPVAVGDCVRFEAIDRARFLALGGDLS